MAIVNNKVLFVLLPEKDQPQKTIFTPHADIWKHAKVMEVGHKVEIAKEKDIITVYVSTMVMIEKNIGICSDRDIIFINGIPTEGKVQINQQSKSDSGLSILKSANVVSSNSGDISPGNKVFYKEGKSHELPDNTEIILESQIYYKE